MLAGKICWVTADANRCRSGRATAAADLRRVGVDDEGIQALASDWLGLPEAERDVLTFARDLTLRSDGVTDDQVARLKLAVGEAKLVAIVQLVAYENLMNRLWFALGDPPRRTARHHR